jgi:hypothetical protein
MVVAFTKFTDIAAFRAAVDKSEIDITQPYLVETCASLNTLLDTASVKTSFGNFRAQMPGSDQVSKRKKAQCPFQGPTLEPLRSAMLEMSPATRVPMEAVLSQWGCNPDMLQAGFEHGALGCLRYTGKGTREVACCHISHLLKLLEEMAGQLGKSVPVLTEQFSLQDLVEKVMLEDMTEAGLQIAEKLSMKAFRGTSAPGSLLYIPSGFVVVERALGADVVFGWRLHILEGENAMKSVEAVEDLMKVYAKV